CFVDSPVAATAVAPYVTASATVCSATAAIALGDATCGAAAVNALLFCRDAACVAQVVAGNAPLCPSFAALAACVHSLFELPVAAAADVASTLAKVSQCVQTSCLGQFNAADVDPTCGQASVNALMSCPNSTCIDQVAKGATACPSFATMVQCVGANCFNDQHGGSSGGGGGGGSSGSPTDPTSCPYALVRYCTSTHDTGCNLPCPFTCSLQPGCPCQAPACQAMAQAPFCLRESGVCSRYKAALAKALYAHGAFAPTQSWQQQQFAEFLVPPSPYNASTDPVVQSLYSACNAVSPGLADNMAACLRASIGYCNGVGYDQACGPDVGTLGVSVCGDGYVTFGESCDDGNAVDGDGCNSMCQIEDQSRWACLKQGQPCFQCARPPLQYGNNGRPVPNQFCTNDRLKQNGTLVPQSSPVYFGSCASVTSIDDALACDVYANTFCANLALQNTSDPGCQPYVNLTRKYTVPTVAQSCEYQIKSIDIGSQYIASIKIAVFTCRYQDPFSLLTPQDATPMFLYQNPYTGLPKTTKDAIQKNATIAAIVNSVYGNRNASFYSVKDIRITDFNSQAFPELYLNNQQVLNGMPEIARLSIFLPNSTVRIPPQQPIDANGNNPNCWSNEDLGSPQITPLPATPEPTRWAVASTLMGFKFSAINYNDMNKAEFAAFDPWSIDTGNTTLNATLNFGVLLSTSNRDGSGNVRENVQYFCSDYSVPWQDQAKSPKCTTAEAALLAGTAFLKFNQQLFQKGCTNSMCDYKVDHCRRVPLTPRAPQADAARFTATAAAVVAGARTIDNARTWADLVGNTVQVAIAANSESFSDATNLFWSLVVKGKATKYLRNVPNYCAHDYWSDTTYSTINPAWQSDPCCNTQMQELYCCAPQDVPNGLIDVVLATNDVAISTYCPGVAAQVRDAVQSTMKALTRADTCSAALDGSTSFDSWQTMSKVSSTCSALIQKMGSTACQKDSDCTACSQSTCLKQGKATSGTCTVPWDNMDGCTLECYQAKMDPELLRYMYDAWGVSVTATDTEKSAMFTSMMTESTCSGPQSWSDAIGQNGYQWQTNLTCQQQHICDDWDYQNYLQNAANQASSGRYSWLNFNDPNVCTANGGSIMCNNYAQDGTTCQSTQCTFASVQGPCKQVNACYQKCQQPYTSSGCASLNGTWYLQDPTNSRSGMCCPPDAYFNKTGTNSICSYAPPFSPGQGSVQDETCCRAANGQWWTQTDSSGNVQGQCCFGKITSYVDGTTGDTMHNCNQDYWGWDNSGCYNECQALQSDCTTCRINAQACQGYVHTTANKTACLAAQTCNNAQYSTEDCAAHQNDAAFCAQCWGNWCYKQGSPATCYYYAWSATDCSSAQGTWDIDANRCYVNGTQTSLATNPWSCFTPGPSICPDPRNNTQSYGPSEVVPKYSYRDNQCQSGCYIPYATQANCTTTTFTGYWGIQWLPAYASGNGACSIPTWSISASDCATLFQGTYVAQTIAYNGGQFNTKDMCDQGMCQGGLNWDGWSRTQCETAPTYSCNYQCQQCLTWNWPFYSQGGGGCFSSNVTYCTGLGLSDMPCLVSHYASQAACASDSNTYWASCGDYSSTTCSSDATAQKMGCQYTYGNCPTRATCEAQGQCNDNGDSWRQQCNDPGWTHGDTCYASWSTMVFDSTTNTSSMQMQSASCNFCNSVDGVCVMPRPTTGCLDNMYHQLGCRIDGIHNASACSGAGITGTKWLTHPTNRADCLALQMCSEPGFFGVNSKSSAECAKCGGTLQPHYTWTPGVWSQPYVQDLTWMPNGTKLVSVNQWRPAIVDYRVREQLATPMVRKLANAKKTQALLSYNTFSNSLGVIACACSGNTGDSSACFNSVAGSVEGINNPGNDFQPSNNSTGITDAFCGSSAPVDAGCDKAVVQKNCTSTTLHRLLRRLGDASAGDKLTVTSTYYPTGPYTKLYEPYCSGTDRTQSNPLALVNSNGVVFGQLLGDGKGLQASSSFSSISLCFNLSLDIRWMASTFPTRDVAVRTTDTTFVPLFLQSFSVLNAGQMCFAVTQPGIYFPVARLTATQTDINALTCAQSCQNGAACVKSAATGTTSCVCKCGYSGATCAIGCLNSCSGKGTCGADNTCACNHGFTGRDCSQYDCPIGTDSMVCSGNGRCLENATCACRPGFQGANCSQLRFTQTQNYVLPKALSSATSAPTPKPTTTSPIVPSKGVPVTPTFAPAPPLTNAPPLPTLAASTCVASACTADFATCMDTFDSCACLPGQLLCAQTKCPNDFQAVVTQCGTMVAQASSCVLTCAPSPYPVTGGAGGTTNVVMAVVANIAIQGVTAAQFTPAVQTKFVAAIASSIPGVTASQVTITAIVDVADRRRRLDDAAPAMLTVTAAGHVARQLTGSHLEVQFSISVSSPAALKATTSSLQAQSGSGGAPSALATALVTQGVVTSTAAIQVKSVKTSVTTSTPAPPTTTTASPMTTAPTTPALTTAAGNGAIIGAAVGGAVGLVVLLGVGCYCCRRRAKAE
ncbi:hypothetical protein As57867_011166, partial [Aphanomyces stellatus]